MPYTKALLHVVSRIYRCPIIDAQSRRKDANESEYVDYYSSQCKQGFTKPMHIDHSLVAVLCDDHLILLKPYREFNVKHALRFSPNFLGDSQCPLKILFVLYQVLEAVSNLHTIGLTLGNIQLHDIKIDNQKNRQISVIFLKNS